MAVSPSSSGTGKYWLAAFFCSVVLFLFFLPQFFFRYHLQSAQNSLIAGEIKAMSVPLHHASMFRPFSVLNGDKKWFALLQGEHMLESGIHSDSLETMLGKVEKAHTWFREAVELVPRDLDGWTGLARSTELLERLYPFLKKSAYPERAQAHFERLLRLMPTNLYAVSLFIRYFDTRKLVRQRDEMVLRSIYLSPSLFYQLRNQPFYNLELEQKLKVVLLDSVRDNVFPEQAYRALSDISRREGDLHSAIKYFKKTKPQDEYGDRSGYFLALGNLQLEAKQYQAASTSFLTGLEKGSVHERRKRMNTVYYYYHRKKEYSAFLKLCDEVEHRFKTGDLLELLRAQCLFQMGQYGFARTHLLKISSNTFLAKSFALQARIAEKQKDWDAMELSSQRATVLDPENSSYHLLFSRSLVRQKKFIQAERAATAAIKSSSNQKSSWLYNNRAWIRWSLKDNEGALHDWERAVSLSPDNAGLYYNMALVYERGGNLPAAINQLERALRKAPGKKQYRDKLDMLKAKMQQRSGGQ